jgi:SAM-dependent methyltransferase
VDYARQYGQMHESGKRFPGYSLGSYVDSIAKLIKEHEPERLLDYGCGKGYQYLARRYHERWPGQLLPYCYDIGVQQLSAKPDGQFGGVINTDMLEHIEKPDLPAILDELIGYVAPKGFLFLGISCRPTRKKLPGGGDVHRTIEPPSWWIGMIRAALAKSPIYGRVVAEFDRGDPPHFPDDETLRWDSAE